MKELLELLENEPEAREVGEATKVNEIPTITRTCQTIFTASVLFTEMKQQIASIQCIYFRGDHYSASCNRISNANERKRVLRDHRRCFLCLRVGHQVQNCDNNARNCQHCNRCHHQSICHEKKIETNQRNTIGRTTRNEEPRVPNENQ